VVAQPGRVAGLVLRARDRFDPLGLGRGRIKPDLLDRYLDVQCLVVGAPHLAEAAGAEH
jgi:hypothetical protein